MAEQVRENYLVRENVLDKEKIDIQKIPHLTQWGNGATPKPTIHRVILPSANGDKPVQNEGCFTEINYEDLITEDDEPVDNIPSEKQQRLLSETLYNSNHLPEPFLVTANVGLFDEPSVPPIVPDVLVSLGVKTGDDILQKENRSYFVWKEGKPPEMVLEIVSNREGNEAGSKLERYAAMGVKYYVIVDHGHYVQEETLIVNELESNGYITRDDYCLPDLNLALTLWNGVYEQSSWPWVRWCTLDGDLLLNGKERTAISDERADQEKERAEEAEIQAEQEKLRAKAAEDRAEQEKLRVEQEKLRAQEAEERVEQERLLVEQEKLRAQEAEERAEQERLLVEQEKLRVQEAEKRAEQERLRAKEAENKLAEQEKMHVEQEKLRAKEAENKLAEQAQLAALYLAKLREAGIEIDGLS